MQSVTAFKLSTQFTKGTELDRKSETHHSLLKKSLRYNTHTDGALSSKRHVPAVGGLASTEFQMDLTNNNRVDVAFSNVGQSFLYTEGSKYEAVRTTLKLIVHWNGSLRVKEIKG